MLRYQKLPATTPKWLVIVILLTGGCLGYAISVSALVALYGVTGFLANFFFAGSLVVSFNEAAFLGVLGLVAAFTAVSLSFLAFDMNILSRKAITLSRFVWFPLVITTGMVWWQHFHQAYAYHLNLWWCAGITLAIVLGGIVPALVLGTSAGKKVHSK